MFGASSELASVMEFGFNGAVFVFGQLRAIHTECGAERCGQARSVNAIIVFSEFNYDGHTRVAC